MVTEKADIPGHKPKEGARDKPNQALELQLRDRDLIWELHKIKEALAGSGLR